MPTVFMDPLMIVLQAAGGGPVAELFFRLLALPFALGSGLIRFGLPLFFLVGLWKLFEKAGEDGLACIMPIFNIITLARIVGWEDKKAVMLFIPGLNALFLLFLLMDLARVFGRGPGFTLGVIALPLIFVPIMGWDDCRYRGVGALV